MRELEIGDTKIVQYTVTDLMKILEISKVTALKLLKSGRLQSVRIGRQYWINETHLLDYLGAGKGRRTQSYGELLKTRIKNPVIRAFVRRLLKL